jgi:hypothetical protein
MFLEEIPMTAQDPDLLADASPVRSGGIGRRARFRSMCP